MSIETLIAWTDHTANFWMGCQKISAGCANCYAETLTRSRMGLDVWGPVATTQRQPVKGIWANLRTWQRAAAQAGIIRRVFVGSLMDWAEDHPGVAEIRLRMWQAIKECPDLHFQMLTKRPENIERFLPKDWGEGWPNVWLGTSVEDMRVAERVATLAKIPASVRFMSYEPALGPLDDLDLTGLDWVIYGGESGPGYRPHDLAWPRAMRVKCEKAGVAFFFKQSSAIRTEMGITLDGETVRKYPTPRVTAMPGMLL
jgi:protein gp37